MPLIEPLKDTNEGYEEPIDSEVDGLAAAGFYPQNGPTPNTDAGVEKDMAGNLVFKDAVLGTTKTLTQLAAGGTGVSEATHEALLQLIHFLEDGPANGFVSGATRAITGTVFPTQILWRRADTTKLVERNLTWSGPRVTTDEWKIYAADGTTVLATVTDTITYSGAFETSRTRAIA